MADGMVSMDFSLRKRFDNGEISAREAYMKANDKASFDAILAAETAEGGGAAPSH
jgi:hypothetical protein